MNYLKSIVRQLGGILVAYPVLSPFQLDRRQLMNGLLTILVTLDEADFLLNLWNAAVGTQKLKFDERQLSSHYSQPKETYITTLGDLGPF